MTSTIILKVNFWKFEADYYIVALDGTAEIRDTEYQWAVVSSFRIESCGFSPVHQTSLMEQYELVLEDSGRPGI